MYCCGAKLHVLIYLCKFFVEKSLFFARNSHKNEKKMMYLLFFREKKVIILKKMSTFALFKVRYTR